MTTLLEVRQDSLLSLGDGNTPPQALLRMGIAPMASKWDLFSLQGRMFNLQEGTTGTPITGSAADAGGAVLTAPSIRIGVPTGHTFFPRRLQIALQAAAGTLNELIVVASETNTYTSGGTAVTPVNWRTDNPRSTVATNVCYGSGAAIVEGTLVRPRGLFKWTRALAFAAAYGHDGDTRVEWDDLIPVVGPAAILIWVSAATTASTFMFGFDWAEVPTVSAITAV